MNRGVKRVYAPVGYTPDQPVIVVANVVEGVWHEFMMVPARHPVAYTLLCHIASVAREYGGIEDAYGVLSVAAASQQATIPRVDDVAYQWMWFMEDTEEDVPQESEVAFDPTVQVSSVVRESMAIWTPTCSTIRKLNQYELACHHRTFYKACAPKEISEQVARDLHEPCAYRPSSFPDDSNDSDLEQETHPPATPTRRANRTAIPMYSTTEYKMSPFRVWIELGLLYPYDDARRSQMNPEAVV